MCEHGPQPEPTTEEIQRQLEETRTRDAEARWTRGLLNPERREPS